MFICMRRNKWQLTNQTVVVKLNCSNRKLIHSKRRSRIEELTPGNDLPALVVALSPLPQNEGGSIAHTAMVLVTMECIKVQVDVVHHPDAAVACPNVPALGPKDRLVQGVWIVPGQKNLVGSKKQTRR